MRHSLFILLNLSVIWEKICEFMNFFKIRQIYLLHSAFGKWSERTFYVLVLFFVLKYIICAIFTFLLFKCANYLYFTGPYSLLLLVTDAWGLIFRNFEFARYTHTSPSTLHALYYTHHGTSPLPSCPVEWGWAGESGDSVTRRHSRHGDYYFLF